MDTELTPWFSGDDRPIHTGVYQRDYYGHYEYSYWNGTLWNWAARRVADAYHSFTVSAHQDLPWRGVLKEPA